MVPLLNPVKVKVTVVNLPALHMVLVRDTMAARTKTVERIIAMDQARVMVLTKGIMGSLAKVKVTVVNLRALLMALVRVIINALTAVVERVIAMVQAKDMVDARTRVMGMGKVI